MNTSRNLLLSLAYPLRLCTAGLRADPLDQWVCHNPSPTGNPLSAFAYGNNQFVAVAGNGFDVATILTSADHDWLATHLPTK